MVFTGAFISAQEALALALINKVVPQEKLRDPALFTHMSDGWQAQFFVEPDSYISSRFRSLPVVYFS